MNPPWFFYSWEAALDWWTWSLTNYLLIPATAAGCFWVLWGLRPTRFRGVVCVFASLYALYSICVGCGSVVGGQAVEFELSFYGLLLMISFTVLVLRTPKRVEVIQTNGDSEVGD